jgi:hypothetical protein
MPLTNHDQFYLNFEEPVRGCLLALKEWVLQSDPEVTAEWKYGMPFFCYKGKMFCYLWVHKKSHQPYIGFVEGNRMDHPQLLQEKRSRMKIFMLDAHKNLPLKTIQFLLKEALQFYKSGIIPIKKNK